MVKLKEHQKLALAKMHNGCILCGDVGSGKSITSIAYYFVKSGGSLEPFRFPKVMRDLYIITTAHKRDTYEWDDELVHFGMSQSGKNFGNKVYVDSWNNISKYVCVKNSIFIFDEQRVIGTGAWVKAFLKITANNEWILLSATPGDKWLDYAPVFIANGFYRNITEFRYMHVIYSPFVGYRKVDRYVNVKRLEKLRAMTLVEMPFARKTVQHHINVFVDYDINKYKDIMKRRFNDETKEPFQNATEMCMALRKVCNYNPAKLNALIDIYHEHPKLIIFYNYDYELDILRDLCEQMGIPYAEWNGHKHQPIPDKDIWMYIVHYSAGAEGWNCILTDTMVYFSSNYSYRTMVQSAGRIDRLNTKFIDLYYYHIKTRSPIDKGIDRALMEKKKFNELKFYEAVSNSRKSSVL